MNSKDGVGATRSLVKNIISSCAVLFTFKKTVEGFFFIAALNHRHTFHVNITFCVILDRDSGTTLLMRWDLAEHIEKKFVINLYVWNLDSDLSVETAANLRENCVYSARNQSSVFVVLGAARHSKGFSSSSLAVAHNSAVDAIYNSGDSLLAAILKNVFLWGIVH